MNDEAKRSRMRAGVIGACVGVAAIGAIVVVATAKDSDDDDRDSSFESKREATFPRVDLIKEGPGVAPVEAGPKWEREARNVKDGSKDDPQLARQQAIEQARKAGILGSQGGAFASLTGTGGISSGVDNKNVYGGLLGHEGGGRSAFGPGGGGTGWGTIGTGRYGTIGHGGGTGSGYGVGGGAGRMRKSAPSTTLGSPTVTSGAGELDKAIVRRYLRRNLQKLTYCYEKELLAKPTLAGTVTARFTILETGMATGAAASGVDPQIGTCVAGVLNAIEFPKPKGTGGVQVNFTLTFAPPTTK